MSLFVPWTRERAEEMLDECEDARGRKLAKCVYRLRVLVGNRRNSNRWLTTRELARLRARYFVHLERAGGVAGVCRTLDVKPFGTKVALGSRR